MPKGKQLFIEGRLKYDSWEDKHGGGKRSKLSVVVENFQFLGGRDAGGAPDGGAIRSGPDESGPPPQRPPLAPPGQAPRPQASPPFGDESPPG